MSLNSSSSTASLHPPPPSPSFYEVMFSCMSSTVGVFIVTALTITKILLLLPLCIFVLYLGHQRWRQQRSDAATSHSDLFTYNIVLSELLGVLASILCCCGLHAGLPQMVILAIHLFFFCFIVAIFFHILTCVERYLAVVHPVAYLDLKKTNWIRFRNFTVSCVWLLGLTAIGFMSAEEHMYMIIIFCMTSCIIAVVCFCSVSVLCVLIRPGPREQGGARERVDQSKLRAFYTIMAILGVLVLRFGWDIFITVVYHLVQLGEAGQCGLMMSHFWISLPSCLVLPLLFLRRAGKLPCYKNSNTTGQ